MKKYILNKDGIDRLKHDSERNIIKLTGNYKITKFMKRRNPTLIEGIGIEKIGDDKNVITEDEYISYPQDVRLLFVNALNRIIGMYTRSYFKSGFEQPFQLMIGVGENKQTQQLNYDAVIVSADKKKFMKLNVYIEPNTTDSFEYIDYDTISAEILQQVIFKVRYLESNGYYDREKQIFFGKDNAKRYYLKYDK